MAETSAMTGTPAGVPVTGADATATGPWKVARRALLSSWTGRFAILVVLVIVVGSLCAPLWAKHVAHTGPFTNHGVDVIKQDGKDVNVVSLDGIPIGPTFQGRFFLGAADTQGRDEMVRLLYGGRNSLQIGVFATIITIVVGTLLALLSGYFRGWVDSVISRVLDILWSTPVILLGVALGVATALGGLNLGLFKLSGDSLFLRRSSSASSASSTSPARSAAWCCRCVNARSSRPPARRAPATRASSCARSSRTSAPRCWSSAR